ncbi:metal-binding protein [Pseudomonas sp. LS44]|uniref:Ada metal-binding domain-containing protein n=1 Tax=Pseudomonas sp. LS44 TaxID=1357074 RepID=UPI00215A39C7|nr:Ada metal-binding domain-containing protein [Pseudomonas sp. LS44]UVE17974.1 metal-binding protein [Pseudomonas sp. LS44]
MADPAGVAKADQRWRVLGPDGQIWFSEQPGTLGGHRRTRIYGRLDCRAALQAIARGGYVSDRVFFLNASAAQAAGYRPCAVCLPADYARWKAARRPS